jgi:hypothetical protein
MADARSMPPCDIGRVGAGKGQMPGVEQQTARADASATVARKRSQGITS